MTKSQRHPTLPLTITFDDIPHTYTDDDGEQYTSATQLTSSLFSPFDALAQSMRLCKNDKTAAATLRAEWQAKATNATDHIGTPAHAYAEACILGNPLPKPTSPLQARHQRMIDYALTKLNATHELYPPEQIIFDPLTLIAGQIDLPARNRRTGALAILDWKTSESITTDSYGKKALPPIAHLPDHKVNHYAIQLSIYAWTLTDATYSAYPSQGEPVELALIHLPHHGTLPVWRPVPYLADDVGVIMRERMGWI